MSEVEPGATSAKARPNSRKLLADDQAKAERREPTPKLSEINHSLNLWQSDCAELRQAGVELRLEKTEVDGKPAIALTLLEVNFRPTCQTFHGTKVAHTCVKYAPPFHTKEIGMQSCLFVGGGKDGLSFPVEDDTDFVQWPVGVTDSEVYARESVSVGGAFIDIFRHDSLRPDQVLERLVTYYAAWAVNRPGGRH